MESMSATRWANAYAVAEFTVTPHVVVGSADIFDVMFPMITEDIELLEKKPKHAVNKQYVQIG